MWGGRATRNAVSSEAVPTEWDVGSGQGVRWTAALGSQTYGNPVVAAGKAFVGTNNDALYDPEQAGDRGVLIAFDESDGRWAEGASEVTSAPLASSAPLSAPRAGLPQSSDAANLLRDDEVLPVAPCFRISVTSD